MSQNSVVLKTQTPEQSAFLTIFLNSAINRTQVTGSYSITKQKYINQGKISQLRIMEYKANYEKFCTDYINGIINYYQAIEKIRDNIRRFDSILNIPFNNEDFIFSIKPKYLDKKILTANYYKFDINPDLLFAEGRNVKGLRNLQIRKGDEIGSENYMFEGVPFIKTSNFQNYSVDYQPNYYCSELIYDELEQDLKTGDILFTKDGNIGEVAIVEESAKVVLCSGIVRIRAEDIRSRYWLFLLLSSSYGKTVFKKWGVIASTMAHLRKDFFQEFVIPDIPENLDNLISDVAMLFLLKKKAFHQIEEAKEGLLQEFNQLIA